MRQIWRPKLILPTLCEQGCGGARAKKQREAREQDAAAKLTFEHHEHWTKPDVRGALYAMHGWVCAYCQCKLPRNDRGDVEHFRPKSGEAGYWWLAYDFDNYLIACSTCNSDRKGTKFPLAKGAVRIDYANRAALAGEKRMLAHPIDDAVEAWIHVEWKDPAREGEVVANVKVAPGLDPSSVRHARATETIELFHLNKDRTLYRERRKALEKASGFHRTGDGVSLRRMASRYQPFGVFVRGFVGEVAPELLPQPAEELRWLLEDVGDRLKDALGGRHMTAEPIEQTERLVKELCWTLAVLWKDPPTGDAGRAEVERWIEQTGHKDLVEGFYAELVIQKDAPENPPP